MGLDVRSTRLSLDDQGEEQVDDLQPSTIHVIDWALESDDAQRAFGGLSTLARMGTVLEVDGGFEDSMQDDLGFLGLRADGRRG
jgi:hypothetical protein